MANHNEYFQKMMRWCGGYVNDPSDSGGATKYDVTLGTWRSLMGKTGDKDDDGDVDADDIKLLTIDDARRINLKFWNDCRATEIKSQSVAESVVEWYWGSGATGIKKIQRLIGVNPDGIIGPQTIDAINSWPPAALHEAIRTTKLQFIKNIVNRKPSQKKFLRGWTNRINDFKFES